MLVFPVVQARIQVCLAQSQKEAVSIVELASTRLGLVLSPAQFVKTALQARMRLQLLPVKAPLALGHARVT